jgi:hypothetical protein
MCKQTLKLVVDNTPVVRKQPFKQPVIVTKGEMTKLRSGFEEWLKQQ